MSQEEWKMVNFSWYTMVKNRITCTSLSLLSICVLCVPYKLVIDRSKNQLSEMPRDAGT